MARPFISEGYDCLIFITQNLSLHEQEFWKKRIDWYQSK